jgi:16S rRNA processing protein RimM
MFPIFECVAVGKVLRPQGFKGAMIAAIEVGEAADFTDIGFLFLQRDGLLVPFKVRTFSPRKHDQVYLEFDGVEGEAAAKELVGQTLWLPEKDLPELAEDSFQVHEIVGWRLFDQDGRDLGPILDVQDYAGNLVMSLEINGKEVLIPLAEEQLLDVNRPGQSLQLEIPEGLLDIYLNE